MLALVEFVHQCRDLDHIEGSQRSCLVEVKTPDLVVMVGGINPSEMLSKRTVL